MTSDDMQNVWINSKFALDWWWANITLKGQILNISCFAGREAYNNYRALPSVIENTETKEDVCAKMTLGMDPEIWIFLNFKLTGTI